MFAREARVLRITREEAEQNRTRIVDAAARLFREKGFNGVGVAELMHAAGLTHGGFYNHFASKEELEGAICDLSFDQAVGMLERTAAGATDAERKARFDDYVANYLSERARDAGAARCPMVALANDAVRQGGAVRRRFAAGIARYVDALERAIAPRGRPRDRDRGHAITTLAMLIGGLILARGVKDADRALSDEILATLREAITQR